MVQHYGTKSQDKTLLIEYFMRDISKRDES